MHAVPSANGLGCNEPGFPPSREVISGSAGNDVVLLRLIYRRKKTGPQAGLFNRARLITSKQPEQQQPKQRQQQPKQPKQQPKQPKQQRQQQPERPEQRWCQPEQPERQQERWLQQPEQPGSRWFLLSSSKQPEQQPAGRRSAGIFS
jgi:hypothetical protein